jgi:hypothetical protein
VEEFRYVKVVLIGGGGGGGGITWLFLLNKFIGILQLHNLLEPKRKNYLKNSECLSYK